LVPDQLRAFEVPRFEALDAEHSCGHELPLQQHLPRRRFAVFDFKQLLLVAHMTAARGDGETKKDDGDGEGPARRLRARTTIMAMIKTAARTMLQDDGDTVDVYGRLVLTTFLFFSSLGKLEVRTQNVKGRGIKERRKRTTEKG
jgi:hypothetical protein